MSAGKALSNVLIAGLPGSFGACSKVRHSVERQVAADGHKLKKKF